MNLIRKFADLYMYLHVPLCKLHNCSYLLQFKKYNNIFIFNPLLLNNFHHTLIYRDY